MELNVTEWRIHPEYDNNTLENDIAVLKLSAPAVHAQPAEMCQHNYSGTQLAACGLGTLFEGLYAIPEVLQEVKLEERSEQNCPLHSLNYTCQICASSSGLNRGICHGDSGGPLYPLVDGVPLCIYGVASGAQHCGFGSGYTRVPFYVEWIMEKIHEMTVFNVDSEN